MNVTDLRSTLEQHAAFPDDGLSSRSTRVHHRVRVVRRRRRAALAGGVAAAVAVVAAGVALPRPGGDEPVPAERQFADTAAPATMEALGYTYSFDRMVTGDGTVSLRQPTSDRPVLLTWADEGTGGMTVDDGTEGGQLGARPSVGGDFEDYLAVEEPGGQGGLTVRGDGEVAIAVYELTGLPDSVGDRTLHFPREGLDASLQDAVVGEPGRTEVVLDLEVPDADQPWSLAEACSGAPEGAWVNLAVAGVASWSQSCSSDVSTSHGVRGSTFPEGVTTRSGRVVQPGERVTARLWVSETEGGPEPRAAAPGLRLGLALYHGRTPVAEIAGWPLPELLSHAGHAWRLVDTAEEAEGDREVGLTTTVESTPRIFVELSRLAPGGGEARSAQVRFVLDGELPETTFLDGSSGHLSERHIVWSGSHRARLSVVAGDPAATALGLAVYERVG